ncbi:MAG: hypothetical protein LBI57_07935 [Helicobacteraceae bacterium]|nr:hypothetical protein [Helicobacteraceae bacterium]
MKADKEAFADKFIFVRADTVCHRVKTDAHKLKYRFSDEITAGYPKYCAIDPF